MQGKFFQQCPRISKLHHDPAIASYTAYLGFLHKGLNSISSEFLSRGDRQSLQV